LSKQQRSAKMEHLADFMPTLGDLAGSGTWWKRRIGNNGWKFQQGPFAGTAQEILRLQEDARTAMLFGNVDRAKMNVSRIDELKKSLVDAGVMMPDSKLDSIREATERSEQHLADLVEKRRSIVIEPRNGP
jgi:hypothetical protein